MKSNSPLPNKISIGNFAHKLFTEIQNRNNGTFLACNLQTNILGNRTMIMRDEHGISPTSMQYFKQIKLLSKRLKVSDTNLPSPLTQSQIHQIQTDIEPMFRINIEGSRQLNLKQRIFKL